MDSKGVGAVRWASYRRGAKVAPHPDFHPLLAKYGRDSEFWQRASGDREVPVVLGFGRGHATDVDFTVEHYFREGVHRLGSSSKAKYAGLIAAFLNWSGRFVADITVDDFIRYKRFRTKELAVSGPTWDSDQMALFGLFKWASKKELMTVPGNPIPPRQGHDQKGARVRGASKNRNSQRYRWATIGTLHLYRDVTFGGQRLERAPAGKGFRAHGEDTGWRGRTGVRNEAFFNLTFGSGLRVKEIGTLLTVEAPTEPGQRVPVEKTAKYERLRRWQVNQAGMNAVSAYIAQDRAWAVKRAQKAGRYDAIQDPL